MKSHCRLHGFTLIELLVTIAIMVTIASLAVPSMKSIAANQSVSNAASDLMTDILQARNLALSKNSQVVVEPLSESWANGWQIYLDKNANSVLDSATDTLVLSHLPFDNFVVLDTGITSQEPIIFQSNGFLVGANNKTIAIQSTASDRKRRVRVERSGRARICDPDKEAC